MKPAVPVTRVGMGDGTAVRGTVAVSAIDAVTTPMAECVTSTVTLRVPDLGPSHTLAAQVPPHSHVPGAHGAGSRRGPRALGRLVVIEGTRASGAARLIPGRGEGARSASNAPSLIWQHSRHDVMRELVPLGWTGGWVSLMG